MTAATTLTLTDVALAWHDAGACVLPAAADGTKRPAVAWADYQHTRPTRQQVQTWADNAPGIGLVCGNASAGLEMLELEGPAVTDGLHVQLRTLLEETGHADLWAKLTTYAELTPGGGLHWLYRVAGPVPGNRKLARTRDAAGHLQVLAETRGEGGWTVLAPSGGPVHPTGKPWQIITGHPGQVATLTVDEHRTLHRAAATFDTADPPPPPAVPFSSPGTAGSGLRAAGGTLPGDHWAETTDWADILTPAGWTQVGARGRIRYWRRPGKNLGISATTGHGDAGDWLYVFTSSTDFEPERTYTKFGAHTVLEHGGDHAAAAAALKAAGYGRAAPEPRADAGIPASAPSGVPRPATDGALATVHQLPAPAVALDTLERSEDGHAQALVATYGTVIRYCPERGRWLTWDGTVWQWQPEDGGHVREFAKTVARTIAETDTGAVAHKRKALSAAGTSGALRQARTDQRITVPLADLDAQAWELNTPGGIVDLRTGQLHPADPSHLHTRVTACIPDPAANTTVWTRFLADTFPDDPPLVGYLQRLVGYSAVGVVGPHVLPFCVGSGGNGKGVFLEAVTGVLGDYATTAPAGFLMAGPTAKHETEIARLAGHRMVLCSEVNESDRFDEAKVKQLTGGDTLTARFMRADHFTFTPTHQLWLMGNHRPEVRAGGDSFWRRLRQIDFKHTVPEPQRIDDLQRILATDHGPAVLAWIIDGAAQYATRGLVEPDSVKVATAEYAHDQDTVGQFLEERCHLGGGDHVQLKAAAVRGSYERWCTEAGETPVTAKAFGLALRRAGVGSGRTKASRFYTGIALLDGDDENASPVTDDTSPAQENGGWR